MPWSIYGGMTQLTFRPGSSFGIALESLGMRAVAEHLEAWDQIPGDASAFDIYPT